MPGGPLWIDAEYFEGAAEMAQRNPEDPAAVGTMRGYKSPEGTKNSLRPTQ